MTTTTRGPGRPKAENPKAIRITPRIDDHIRATLAGLFKTPNAGAEWALEWTAIIIPRTLHALRGRFREGELLALLAMHNGHWLMPGMCGPDHLALMVRDSEPDGLPQAYGYDTADLVARLSALTPTEAAALAVWACAYWTAGYSAAGMDAQEYARRLSGE